jgi:hypothetical protein
VTPNCYDPFGVIDYCYGEEEGALLTRLNYLKLVGIRQVADALKMIKMFVKSKNSFQLKHGIFFFSH